MSESSADEEDPDPAWTIENIASRLHPTVPKSDPRVLAVLTELHAYMDESGTHRGSKIACVGGCVAASGEWSTWNREWQAVLKNPGTGKSPLSYFHSTDAAHSRDQFYGWPKEEANAFALKLIPIINKNRILKVSAAVDMAVYDEVITGELRTGLEDPYYLCMLMCISMISEVARPPYAPRKTRVSYIFEENKQFAKRAHEIFENIKRKRDGARRFKMGAIAFDNCIDSPMLQASDIVAYETHREMRRKLGEVNVQYANRWEPIATARNWVGKFLGRDALEQIAREPEKFIDKGV